MDITKLKTKVFEILDTQLPPEIHYHTTVHTKAVMDAVVLIGAGENLGEKDTLTLQIAALFHDTGYLLSYHHNEPHGVAIATEMLPVYGVPTALIAEIGDLILSTDPGRTPHNHLAAVLKDADMSHLGSIDYHGIAEQLGQEIGFFENEISAEEWIKRQIHFIENHHYYTQTAKQLYESVKISNLKELKIKLANSLGSR